MSDKILIVTSPDDILLQGIRILNVELNNEQSSMVSQALLKSQQQQNLINYVWKMGDPVTWLLDKIPKSDIIIFNAAVSANGAIELILGYIAAQPQSYYFGPLRDLHHVNDHAIYTSDDLLLLLENIGINIYDEE